MNMETNAMETPRRRSTRKIVRPLQDYDEIVKRSLCHRKEGGECVNDTADEHSKPEQPKNTPAKVRRVSENRSRKSRPTVVEKANGDGNGAGGGELTIDNQNTVPKEVTIRDDSETDGGNKEKPFDVMNETVASKGQEAINIAEGNYKEDQCNVEVLEDSVIEVNTSNSIPTEITVNDSLAMEPLLVSDDEEKQNSTPPMVINVDEQSETILTTPLTKQYPKAGRFPTPYKAKESLLLNPHLEDLPQNESGTGNEEENVCELPIITITAPKDNILRGIRKRSLSLCLDNEAVCSQREPSTVNRVKFCSPINHTTLFVPPYFDFKISQNTQKTNTEDETKQTPSNVTKRRKRSMSIDDPWLGIARKPLSNTTALRHGINTPSKIVQTLQKVPTTRTKLPNFAAIHEKQFKQMENLVDHMARKAERAKILTNSEVKLVSAQKRAAVIAENAAPKRVVSKRINMDAAVSAIPIAKPHHRALRAVESAPPISKAAAELGEINDLTLGATAPPTTTRKPVKSPTTKVAAKITTCISKTVPMHTVATPKKPLTIVQAVAKPAFNLSTAVPTQPLQYLQSAPPPQSASTASAPTLAVGFAATQMHEDKVASRRQRHIQMFKGRGGGGTGAATRQQAALIRGVRSNRRFDLQMQHRRFMEENN